ncbi:MAG: GDP-mannose 4,6-dehydratase [Patescibacteria group bacterium]
MKSILITGASGFVGGYLCEYLLQKGEAEIYGTYSSEGSLDRSPVKDNIHFIKADFTDKQAVRVAIAQSHPDYVYHLAAQSNVPQSFEDPIKTLHANIDSQIYLLDVLREQSFVSTRVLIVGSAETYGRLDPQDIPIKETTPFRPVNPYAVSKITQDYIALQYYLSYQLPLIRVRPFNHIGPRQKTGFVTSDFARQIAHIEKGKQKPIIHIGNLEARRDFTDVRDMVRAYVLLLERGKEGEVYNIGSGVSHSIQEVLDILLSLSSVAIHPEVDATKLRPSDVPEIRADTSKMHNLTGWKPEISLEESLKAILDYWRKEV